MFTKRIPMPDRFWAKVEKTDSCWLWQGAVDGRGYGMISVGGYCGQEVRVHRYSWELAFGAIPKGLCVCHKCDVRNCVRPDHLFLGTKKDNTQDMIAKGRKAIFRGEQHPKARLSWLQVKNIRLRHSQGARVCDLAAQYSVSYGCVQHIVQNLNWVDQERNRG